MCVTLSWGVKTFIELTPAVPITRDLIIFNEWLVDMSKKFKLRLNFPTKINDTFTNRQIKWLWGPRGKHRSLVAHWLLVPGNCGSNLGGGKISSLFFMIRDLTIFVYLWINSWLSEVIDSGVIYAGNQSDLKDLIPQCWKMA